jgi:purine-nucleoside phosphorylase
MLFYRTSIEIIFIGTAFGIMKGIEIGSYVIPNCVQALDGLIKVISEENYSKPNEFMLQKIVNAVEKNNERYILGKTVSVPSTFFQPPKEKLDTDCIALEMEFSSICYVSEKLEMKYRGILIVSDNEEHSFLDDQSLVYKKWIDSFKMLKHYLD